MTFSEKYSDCLDYIDKYWDTIIFKPSTIRLKYSFINLPTFIKDKKNNPHTLFVPHSYFVPNLGAQKRICYWDSFFMFRGLMGTTRQSLMKKMVNNFTYLYGKYKIIPNFNAPASINRSQPPFLSSMILDSYFTPLNYSDKPRFHAGISSQVYRFKNLPWLIDAMTVAKEEYKTVWIDKENFYNHHVPGYNLSRYGDRDIGYAHSSELESGWDLTSRFYNRCDQFLPIDLNSLLYKYEKDFEFMAKLLNNSNEEKYWKEKSETRKKEINKYMWDDNEKFFFDYGYEYKSVSHFFSLASYMPMWTGLATADQAKHMVEKLKRFETPYGLTISDSESLAKPVDLSKIQRRYHPAINDIIKPKQWDYPNIWSPLEYLTVIGLIKYGFIADAKRIMKKSVIAHAKFYRKHKTFAEKLDGQNGDLGKGALYGDQKGFGWTNAVFYRYVKILDSIESMDSIYVLPKSINPPYSLAIQH